MTDAEYVELVFWVVMAVLVSFSLRIPFMLLGVRYLDQPPLVPRNCFDSAEDYEKYLLRRFK